MSDNIDHLQWEEGFLGDWYAEEQRFDSGKTSTQCGLVDVADTDYSSQCGLPTDINGTSNDWFYQTMAHYAEEDRGTSNFPYRCRLN